MITEVGIGRTTHRAVAERAGVPLGATTYYFPALTDLVAAGLEKASADIAADVRTWADRLGDGTDLPRRLAGLVGEYLDDRERATTELELYLAVARDPALRPLARAWLDEIHQILAPRVGDQAARRLAVFVDGVILQHLVTGEPVDLATVGSAMAALCDTGTR